MENEQINVSVIVPVYNTEQYLRECLDSLIRQTYSHLQIILVDDGSTDSSGTICEEYAKNDPRISVVHKENGGQSSARNVGIDLANGKYIYFLDSDDYLKENAIEELVNTAEQESADIVFFESETFVDFGDTPGQEAFTNFFNYERKRTYDTKNSLEQFLALEENSEYFVCTPLHLYKTQYIKNNSIRFTEGIIHEDELFSAQIYLHNGLAAHSHQNLYMRRVRPGSTMTARSEEVSLYRYNSAVTIYYALHDSIKTGNCNKKVAVLFMARTIPMAIRFYNALPQESKNQQKKGFSALRRHALLHYGKNDVTVAKMCSGRLLKIFIRILLHIKK